MRFAPLRAISSEGTAIIIYLSLLVALIGVLLYVLATRAELKEIGRLSFAVGLLAFLLKAAEPALHIP